MTLAYRGVSQPQSDAFPVFQERICRSHFRVRAEPKNLGDFAWGWRIHDFGEVGLTEILCDPVLISRSMNDISCDKTKSYFVTLQLSGRGIARQAGQEAVLDPGDFTLLDSSLPYEIRFDEPVRRLILKVPQKIASRRIKSLLNPLAFCFCGSSGISAVFVNYLAVLAQERGSIESRHFDMLADKLMDLLVAAIENDFYRGQESNLTTNQATAVRHIKDYILLHLSDPTISVKSIADRQGITDRYLHSLFRCTGASVTQWVRDQRLERCKDDLSNTVFAKKTVSEICFSWGFNDAAHFSRRFKEKYGDSPRAYRTSILKTVH